MKRIIALILFFSMLLCGCDIIEQKPVSQTDTAKGKNNIVSRDDYLDIEFKYIKEYSPQTSNRYQFCAAEEMFYQNLSDDGTLVIPSNIDNTPVASVCNPSRELKAKIKSIVIEEGVEFIYLNAFAECPNLTSVTLPSTLKGIASQAFFMCPSLETINIPESVEYIGALAFFGCGKLTGLEYPESAYAVTEDAFYYCENLPWAQCPNKDSFCAESYETIGAEIYVPGSVNAIAPEGFAGYATTEVHMYNGIELIGERAFYNCTDLRRVIMPPSVTYIGEEAFTGCYDELVIYGEFGSYAEQWANEHGITFGLYVF